MWVLRPLSWFRFTDELFAYSKNLFGYILIDVFYLYKITAIKLKFRKPSPSRHFKKHTWAPFFSAKFDLNDEWLEHGKKNAKLAILKGLGCKHLGPERKPLRKKTFVIWGYDYKFVRGKTNGICKNRNCFYNFLNIYMQKTTWFFCEPAFVTIFDLMRLNILQHCSIQLVCILGGQANIRLACSNIYFNPPMCFFLFETQDICELLVAFVVLKCAVLSPWSIYVSGIIFCLLASPHENLC